MSMSRGGPRRRGDRGDYPEPGLDRWNIVDTGGPPRPPPKAGDLSNFGKINKSTPMTFGPSSIFAGKKNSKRETLSHTSSGSNIYHLLSEANPNHVPRKASVDVAEAPREPLAQRKKLVLQPRTKPVEEPIAAPALSNSSSMDKAPAEPSMSVE